jgi:AraC family transcriptional regulator
MPMAAMKHFGTNSDNSLNEDYCCFCFQNGGFTHNLDLNQTIERSISYMDGTERVDGRSLTKNELALKMKINLPKLKRWQKHTLTHQEYYKAVNKAVDYINGHLTESINLSDLGQVAILSDFHFHRIFKSVMGESPGDYIQRLRLEKTAFKLQTTQLSISEISETTGYQSPHALSKAFKKRFGVSPALFRKKPIDLIVPTENIEAMKLHPKIRTIKDKEVVYTRVINPYHSKDAFTKAWRRLMRFMGIDGMPGGKHEYFSTSYDTPTITEPDLCRVYVCATNADKLKPSGPFGVQTIKGGLFAIFTSKGSYRKLERLYCNIYRFWIPNSNYELRDVGFFEKYLNSPDFVTEDELLTEVYIPVSPLL